MVEYGQEYEGEEKSKLYESKRSKVWESAETKSDAHVEKARRSF
jgi:hypothetical protein